jgi:MFS family permease
LSSKTYFKTVEPGKQWSIVDRSKRYVVAKTKDGLSVSAEKLGRPGISGYFLSAMTVVGVIAGIILALLLRTLGPYCAAVGIAAMAVGYGLLGYASSLAAVFISMLCIGFSSGVLMPLLLLYVAKITPDASRAIAMAVVSCGIYLGQFLSPVVLKAASAFPGADVFRSQFNFLAACLSVATVFGLFAAIKAGKAGFEEFKSVKVPGH